MKTKRIESPWVSFAIFAACFTPLILVAAYVYIGVHFIAKYW
jgi:hypothetical protein